MVLQFDYPIDIPMVTKFLASNNVHALIYPQMIKIYDKIDDLNYKIKGFIKNVQRNNCSNSKANIYHVFSFGEIYKVYFPEQNKKRPCIIYQTDDAISNNQVLVIPITTQTQRADLSDNFIFSINKEILRYVHDISNIDTSCSCTLYSHSLQPIYKNRIYEFIGIANDTFLERIISIMNKILPTAIKQEQVQDNNTKIISKEETVQVDIPKPIPEEETVQDDISKPMPEEETVQDDISKPMPEEETVQVDIPKPIPEEETVQDDISKPMPEEETVQVDIPEAVPEEKTAQRELLLHKLTSPCIITNLNNIKSDNEKIEYILKILGFNKSNKKAIFLHQLINTALNNDNKDYDSLIHIQKRIYCLKISQIKLKVAISKCINSLNLEGLSEINFIYILVSLIKNNMEA